MKRKAERRIDAKVAVKKRSKPCTHSPIRLPSLRPAFAFELPLTSFLDL